MASKERKFWEVVHAKMNSLYSRKMFLTDESNIDEMIGYLKKGGFIGAALDVAEIDQSTNFIHFNFFIIKSTFKQVLSLELQMFQFTE